MGGRAVIEWQVDLARDFGCERIICLCQGSSPELIDLQNDVEASGLQFNLISGPLHLVGLASADQDIVVFADGLVIDRELALGLLGDRRGMLALPAEAGIAAGFERIDAEHAWAGLFASRANIVEQLADLPPDGDTISLLLRLALQAGTRRIPVEEERLDRYEILLANDKSQLDRRERSLLDGGGQTVPWSAPGQILAHLLSRRLAPDGLARGPAIATGAAALFGLGAVVLSGFDHSFAALCALILGGFSLAVGNAMRGLKARLLGRVESPRVPFIANILQDVLAIAALTLPSLPFMLPKRVFLPLVLFGLIHLAARAGSSRWKGLWADRTVLFLVLAPAAWFGSLTQAIALIILAALVYCLFSQRNIAITTD